MAVTAAALIFIIFSLNILITVSSRRLHTSFNSEVQVQEGNNGTMATNCKPKPDEVVQNIKFAAGHGGAAAHGGGVAHGSSAGHGVGGAHGEGGSHGDGNGESSSTPGTANAIPVYGAAAARRREHQSHKGGVHGHTSNLTMVIAAIFLSIFF